MYVKLLKNYLILVFCLFFIYFKILSEKFDNSSSVGSGSEDDETASLSQDEQNDQLLEQNNNISLHHVNLQDKSGKVRN